MKKRLSVVCFSCLVIICLLFITVLIGCGKDDVLDFENGGFEKVSDDATTWIGWTKTGTAFSARGISSVDEISGESILKTGDKFFAGLDGGTQMMVGTLSSNAFKLTGTGYIAFKMGAAKHGDKVYVQFIEAESDKVLATVTNTDFDNTFVTVQLIRKVVDLKEHLEKEIYVKIVDEDNSDDFGYINVDDFVICMTDEDVTKYNNERETQLNSLGKVEFEEDEKSTTIQNPGFETGDLTGWKILDGTAFRNNGVVSTSQYYWEDRLVYGFGDYYFDGSNNGETVESAIGAIRSSKFTLAGDGYISFMIGSGPTNCYVALCDGNTDQELIKVTNTAFNDPKLALTLLRVYVDAKEYLGKVLYIKVVDDNASSGFAFINVDDFRVSMTESDVKRLQDEQYDLVQGYEYNSSTYDDLTNLKSYYNNYNYLFTLSVLKFDEYAGNVVLPKGTTSDLNTLIKGAKASFGAEEVNDISLVKLEFNDNVYTTGLEAITFEETGTYVLTYKAKHNDKEITATITIVVADSFEVVNGGFETGDLTGWEVLTEGWGQTEGKYDGVISAETYWGEKLTYNQEGSFHLDGWNNGIGEAESWGVRSSEFVLSGSGFITVRMGGNASAVKVYLSDGTLVGMYKSNRFSDTNFPFVNLGGSWADMATYVIDLTAYIGQKLYIELVDTGSGPWAHAFFDAVHTYYEEALTVEGKFDSVIAPTSRDETEALVYSEIQIPWVFAINSLVVNGGFETGDLTGWEVLTEGWGQTEGKYDGVISAETYWGEKLTYNQEGSFHLDGWNNGIGEAESWAVRSSEFVLSGSGFITVRMGGNASAVKVYLSDGTLVGMYKSNRFSDTNFPFVNLGGSWADMATYVIDLTAYIGQKLYIELVDTGSGPWAHAFFDAVHTYYEEALTVEGKFDSVIAPTSRDETEALVYSEIQIPWVLATITTE